MLIISEFKISEFKRIDISLQECFGIGKYISKNILVKLGFNIKMKQKNINKKNYFSRLNNRIIIIINYYNYKINTMAKNEQYYRLKLVRRKKNLKSLRHFLKLPVRGQRTHNNAQTQKHKRPNWRRIPVPGLQK